MNVQIARLAGRVQLTGSQSNKDVYHLDISFDAGTLDYSHGDSLAIYPKNPESDVSRVLEWIDGASNKLFVDLTEKYCIRHPSKGFLSALRDRIADKERFDSYGDKIATASIPELLQFSHTRWTEEEILPLLGKLRPRLYSIASSPKVHRDVVQLIIVRVQFANCFGREENGVASHYICSLAEIGDPIQVSVVRSKFKLPEDDSVDVIMIGPGTGIAPFRSFLQEREARRGELKEIGRQWLFFGDQHREHNFYYKDEIERWQQNGVLDRLDLAFSRDQDYKIYVQDRMLEHADDIWAWICSGAYIYVCGDAARMAVDVESALKKIILEDGGVADADQFIQDLKRSGRYQRDVY